MLVVILPEREAATPQLQEYSRKFYISMLMLDTL